jgi:IS1 family transposase
MLVEGVSLRSVTRLTGVHRTSAMRLMLRAGDRCRRLLDRRMRGLNLTHLEVDEIWTFVLKKQGRLGIAEAGDDTIGDQYLFMALDQRTKLIPSFLVGKRTALNAQAFMEDLAGRIVRPGVCDPGPRPQISTDGFAGYPFAVDLAFANTVDFGVIIKDYRESEQPGRYGPPEMVAVQRRPVTKDLNPALICTSHIERANLSVRTFLRRFTRLALGFSKKLENLGAAVALFLTHYNYCRPHGSLPGTPAMRAGIAGHVWTLEELLETAGAIE